MNLIKIMTLPRMAKKKEKNQIQINLIIKKKKMKKKAGPLQIKKHPQMKRK